MLSQLVLESPGQASESQYYPSCCRESLFRFPSGKMHYHPLELSDLGS